MKPKKRRFGLLKLALIMLLVPAGWGAYAGQAGIIQTIKGAVQAFDDEKAVDAVLSVPGNIVLVKKRYQGGTFHTVTRTDKISRYKCSQCHLNGQDGKKVMIEGAAKQAHADISLDHGGVESPLSCFTCHSKIDRNALVSEKGVKIDLDHSYLLCGQCHFRQEKDWIGGAHGKRVANWAGKRVVQNCTACHNPHSPLFAKRWPKTYSPPLVK